MTPTDYRGSTTFMLSQLIGCTDFLIHHPEWIEQEPDLKPLISAILFLFTDGKRPRWLNRRSFDSVDLIVKEYPRLRKIENLNEQLFEYPSHRAAFVQHRILFRPNYRKTSVLLKWMREGNSIFEGHFKIQKCDLDDYLVSPSSQLETSNI